jgi:hypothetical protein
MELLDNGLTIQQILDISNVPFSVSAIRSRALKLGYKCLGAGKGIYHRVGDNRATYKKFIKEKFGLV